MRRSHFAACVAAAMAAAAFAAVPASAASAPRVGVREVPLDKKYSTDALGLRQQPARALAAPAAAPTPAVGTVRQWIALDDFQGRLYRKDYTLRGVGSHIEAWVANDLAFPAGDCRTQIASSTQITDAQVAHLISEFDGNMYPKETSTFSTPPDRDGTNAVLGPDANGNGGVYTGGGEKTVALIDNVRDDNYYSFPAAPTYIAGFFSSQFNELVDRNVMTVDAFDWLHRTTANPRGRAHGRPVHEPPGAPEPLRGHVRARVAAPPALLHRPVRDVVGQRGDLRLRPDAHGLRRRDGDRVRPRAPTATSTASRASAPSRRQFNPNPRDCGGPENSLNLWGEGNPNAVLADYGNAYSMMLYLADRYGRDIISRLHNDGELQGLPSLQAALKAEGAGSMYGVIHDFQSMVLLDKIVGDSKRSVVLGVPKRRVTTPSLRSTVNLANPNANDDPGAAPNGADYVALQGANGKVLKGRDLRSLTFTGAKQLPPLPLAWTIVSDDPDRPGNPVLFSGNANNTDASAVTPVTVPTADPTLRFLAKYGAEFGFDYGYVQVSTDGGATYTTIPGDKTIDAPLGPGLNGTTTGFEPHSYDLSAYAGQSVLVAFRYVSDGGVNEGGLLVDDITVGGTAVSDGSSLAPFKSPTQIHPIDVHNWNVRLVGINEGKVPVALQVEFNGRNSVRLTRGQLALASPFQKVVAIVAYDEPTEQVQQYAPYTLTVNGALQPGGTPAG